MKITPTGDYIKFIYDKHGGLVEETKVEVEKKVVPKKRKVKSWGDNGFVGKIQFGCYEYTVKFLPEKDVVAYID
jgi:hypothetical protein